MTATVGISDLSIYIPSPRLSLEALLEHRIREAPQLARTLRRAIQKTGQIAIRFPKPWEDSVTHAAQSARALMRRNINAIKNLRYIGTGTESTVDQSKPMAAYVQGMLQGSGLAVPNDLMTFQAQHACAGGTIAMMTVAGLLALSPRQESGLVISSDIARYDAPSTAEITQGAGAVSMLIEKNPRLLELDFANHGLESRDVDDFFRPNGSVTAKVKGGYSMQCYNESLDAAFHDHCDRVGVTPAEMIRSTDLFVLHVPFKLMAVNALKRLVSHHLDIHGDEVDKFVNSRGFEASLEPVTRTGNLYTASAFLALAYLLKERYQTMGRDIIGKRLLFGSYGSGNTMIVMSGKVAPGAPEVIESWDLDEIFRNERESSILEYETWLDAPHPPDRLPQLFTVGEVEPDSFYLSGIRDDGYREYAFKPE